MDMKKEALAEESVLGKTVKKKKKRRKDRESRQLLVMCLPMLIKTFIFSYIPLIGIVMAFQFYIPRRGLFGSEWVGWENFSYLLKSSVASRLVTNAIVFNLLFVVFATVTGILLGLFYHEISNRCFLKITQTIAIFPFFVSWPLVGVLLQSLLGNEGVITNFLSSVFGTNIDFYQEPRYWRTILTISYVWKNAGLGAITYYAVLTGIDRELYEAAEIDGAGRFRRMFSISIPQLKLMVILNMIMSCANILRCDFNMIYFVTNNKSALLPTTDVIETYMFRALRVESDYSIGTATGLFQGAVGLVLTLIMNKIANLVAHESLY